MRQFQQHRGLANNLILPCFILHPGHIISPGSQRVGGFHTKMPGMQMQSILVLFEGNMPYRLNIQVGPAMLLGLGLPKPRCKPTMLMAESMTICL